jgi:Ca2+-transporting ATPase
MGYILAVHVPIAGMSILPLIFNLPTVLLPAHIAFLELIIDPACSIVFESKKEDENIMKRPPRNLHQPIFNFKTVSINILQGISVLLTTFIIFVFMIKTGRGELEARTFAFTSLVIGNLILIVINLSWDKSIHKILLSTNKMLSTIFVGTLLCLSAVIYIPFFSELFHLTPLHATDFILISIVILISLAWFEILKLTKIIN